LDSLCPASITQRQTLVTQRFLAELFIVALQREGQSLLATSWRADKQGWLDLAIRNGGDSVIRVSATEIIQELPKLSPAERRTVRRVLADLAAKEEDVQLCNQVATKAAMMFDRMEEEDARRQQG
jgi:hypothetical protein